MWEILAAATPPETPPEVPYESIGLVLVAIITGISGLAVAVVQRNSKKATPPVTLAPEVTPVPVSTSGTGSHFLVSENDWVDTRNRAICVESDHKTLSTDYHAHVESSQEAIAKVREELARIKGTLGLQ